MSFKTRSAGSLGLGDFARVALIALIDLVPGWIRPRRCNTLNWLQRRIIDGKKYTRTKN
jgi:hypothetical protein